MHKENYKIIKTNKPVTLLQYPNGKTDYLAENIIKKQTYDYIEIECVATTTRFCAHGYTPKKPLYFATALHPQKTVVLRKVERIFNLKPTFKVVDEEKKIESGIQFARVENREELEHRRKSYNYGYKMFMEDEVVRMKYVSLNFLKAVERIVEDEKSLKTNSILEKIEKISLVDESERLEEKCRKVVLNAKIVNRNVLSLLYPGCCNKILDEMTFHCEGRFILKNEFYKINDQKTRCKIIESINENGFVPFSITTYFKDKEIVVLKEICGKQKNGYFLKGEREETGLENEKVVVVDSICRIKAVFNGSYFLGVDEIISKSRVKDEEVVMLLQSEEFLKLANEKYVLKDNNKIKMEVVEMFSFKKSIRKSEFIKKLTDKFGDAGCEGLEIVENYCDQKGSFWCLKE